MGEERDDRLAWREAWGVARSSLSQGLPLTALSRALRGLSSDWDFDEAQALATYCLGGAASLEGLPDLADWASDEEALVALRDVFLWWGAEEDEEAPCPEAEGLLMDAPILRVALVLEREPALKLLLSRLPSRNADSAPPLTGVSLTARTPELTAHFEWYRHRGKIGRAFWSRLTAPSKKKQEASGWTFGLEGNPLGPKPFRILAADDPFELMKVVLDRLPAPAG
jgi:hypothetical protein